MAWVEFSAWFENFSVENTAIVPDFILIFYNFHGDNDRPSQKVYLKQALLQLHIW